MAESHELVRRAPVLMPGRYAGIEIPRGRSTRIELADDGSLVVHDAAGSRTVADPHEITKAVVLTGAQPPRWADKSEMAVAAELMEGPLQLLALLAGPRPVLVVRLNEFTPHPPSGLVRVGDPDVLLRDQSGASSLCRALGLPIEAPTPDETEAVRGSQGRAAAVLLTDPAERGPRVAPLIAGAAGVVAFAAWPLGFSALTALVSGVAAVLVLPLAWRTFRGRLSFFRVADSEVRVPDSVRFVATEPPTNGLRDAWLELSPQRCVFHARGLEIAAAGPALGGVVACEAWDELVYFKDAEGEVLLSLGRPCFFAGADDLAALEKVCVALDVRFDRYRSLAASVEGETPRDGDEEANIARDRRFTGLVPFSWQAGGAGGLTPWFTWIVTMMLFVSGFGMLVVQEQLWAVPFLVLYTAMLAMATYSSVALSRWSRRQRRKVRHVRARG